MGRVVIKPMTKTHLPVKISLIKIKGCPEQLQSLDAIFNSLEPTVAAHLGHPRAESEWRGLPPNVTRENKFYFLATDGDAEPIGCVDIIRGHPKSNVAYIGLMVIHTPFQRQGLGTHVWQLVEEQIGSWKEVTLIRLGVAKGYEAAAQFWTKMGFEDTGALQTATNVTPHIVCRMFEKTIHSQIV